MVDHIILIRQMKHLGLVRSTHIHNFSFVLDIQVKFSCKIL